MITVTIDHSYEDDYFMISSIDIRLEDEERAKAIKERFKRIEQSLVDPDRELRTRIANALEVDVNLIEVDTEEIDLM